MDTLIIVSILLDSSPVIEQSYDRRISAGSDKTYCEQLLYYTKGVYTRNIIGRGLQCATIAAVSWTSRVVAFPEGTSIHMSSWYS